MTLGTPRNAACPLSMPQLADGPRIRPYSAANQYYDNKVGNIRGVMRNLVRLVMIWTVPLVALFATVAWSQSQAPPTPYPQPVKVGASNNPTTTGTLPTATPAGAADTTDTTTPTSPVQSVAGLIGVGDLLKVSVLGAPDYDQQARVAGDGDVSLALIGQVHVAGLTPQQAQDLIRKKLTDGSYFTDPQVSVFQLEFATQGVSVLGEVQRPGVYPILGPRRLFDALSLAGGTTLKASDTVTITHRDSRKSTTVKLSNDPAKNEQANVQIFPGDTIMVAKAGIVYVVGDVHQPSGVVMENGNITVLQAIAMAGGINPNAKLNSAKIIRRTAQGPVEVPLQLKEILAAKAPDVVLRPEDIVFVPNSAAKSATKNVLENAVRLATGIAIYRVP